VERVGDRRVSDVVADVLRERRVDLVEDVLPVEQRPHLADRLVADAGDDPVQIVEDGLDGGPLRIPVLLRQRELRPDRAALPALGVDVGHDLARRLLVCEVIDPSPSVDDRLERRMRGDIADLLAVDPHLAPVADRLPVFLARPDHRWLRR
jgi:hypothetical protein